MEKQILSFDAESAYLNGKIFYMAFGDLHYYRISPTNWKRRPELAKDFGINVIQIYMPWNLHEPKPSEFNFEGIYARGAR